MSFQDEQPFVPADFRGVVRLFPVPNLVMFPHVMQPLHVFEPRYRELTEAALGDDRLIATAQFEAGWEPHYDGRPPLKPFGCLGKIVTHHRMPDGRFNLLLVGVARIRIVKELPSRYAYREAQAHLLEDCFSSTSSDAISRLHDELVEAFRGELAVFDEAREHLEPLLEGEISLGALTDIAAFTLHLPVELKEYLLAEIHADRRARCLLDYLAHSEQDLLPGKFPPDFSQN